MPDQQIRMPVTDDHREALGKLLNDVPTSTIVVHDWKSEPGQVFIKELRRIQLTGVPLKWIAKELGVSGDALNGAVGYWRRQSSTRGRIRDRRRTAEQTKQ